MRLGSRNTLLIVLTLLTAAGIVLVVNSGRGLGFTPIGVADGPAPRPASPIGIPVPPVARNIYLAPFGDFPRAKAEALVAHYEQQFGLRIQVTPSIPLPPEAVDAGRNQVIAEQLIEAISATEVALADPEAVIIGLTDRDMYIASLTWDYAYGLRSRGTTAIASSARLNAMFADEAQQMERLRKIVTKDLGILYYGLEPSDDPRSVLYRDILGPSDLDRVSEEF